MKRVLLLLIHSMSNVGWGQGSAAPRQSRARGAGCCICMLSWRPRHGTIQLASPLSAGAELPPGVHIPSLPASLAGGSGRCNDYLPGGSTLKRFVWVVRFYAANGGSMPAAVMVIVPISTSVVPDNTAIGSGSAAIRTN